MGRPPTIYTWLSKRWLHMPAVNLSFVSDSQQHLVTEKAQSPNIFKKRKSDSRMIIWDIFFCYLILLRSNLKLRLSSKKCLTIYSTQIQNYSKLVTDQTMFVHILFQSPYSRQFWNNFESFWCLLSNQQARLSLQNVIFGIRSKQCPLTNLLNYFIVVVKLFLWDFRRNQIHPKIKSYLNKLGKNMKLNVK